MKVNKVTLCFLLALVAISFLFLAAHKSLHGETNNPDEGIYDKLDRILQVEEQILNEISSAKEKLDAIQRQTNKL